MTCQQSHLKYLSTSNLGMYKMCVGTRAQYLEEALSSFSQTPAEIFSGSVHLLPPLLLVFLVHSDGSQAFAYRACYTRHHPSCTP